MEVPKGKSSTSILLRDALHAPDMGLIVVSVTPVSRVTCVPATQYLSRASRAESGTFPHSNGIEDPVFCSLYGA